MVNSRVQSCTLVFKDLVKASPLEIATLILLAFSRQNDSKHGRTLESTFSSYPPQVDVAPSGAESHSGGGGGGAAGKRDRGEEKERKAMGK